jgi:tetratricopeptide (TPR) repeat protein
MPFSSLVAFFDPFGSVPGSSLSRSRHALLEKSARGERASGPTIDTDRIGRSLESAGRNVAEVVRAVDWLVSELDLRLDEQAIDDEQNKDTTFTAAAWAALERGDLERARGHFRKAAQATTAKRDAETRHTNAVYLAARLTFALDGPQAALRELDAAEPFIDPGLRGRHPALTSEQLWFSCLSFHKTAAIKFDRVVYYTAAGQLDAALETFREIAEDHDVRFCLIALTDPVLATNDAVVDAARETLRIHQTLTDEIHQMLPACEARWRALQKELQQHGIRNAMTIDARARFDELFTPHSGKRKTLDETWPWPPSRRWLENFSATLRDIDRFGEHIRPLIERERMREAALEAAVQDLLRENRKYRLVDRARTEAVVGRRYTVLREYEFKRITVDEDGRVTVTEHAGSAYLMRKVDEEKRK